MGCSYGRAGREIGVTWNGNAPAAPDTDSSLPSLQPMSRTDR